tara:strand:- start:602 stop:763 length:162 start_codon:yes stop_codon:yes gene_type:complete
MLIDEERQGAIPPAVRNAIFINKTSLKRNNLNLNVSNIIILITINQKDIYRIL